MNNINIFNKYDIENKLKDFKEGQDYSISPTDEPNIKTYNFHNDKLRSVFRNDRVPVRITRETYDGKDYKYRGHFEEGKDYKNNLELKKNGPVFDNGEIAMHQKYLTEFQEKKHFYEMRLIEERDHPKSCCEKHLQEYLKSAKNANGSDYSGLQQENHDLRQQLAEVKKQLAEVLEELRKLKNNSSGSDSEKLEQQIIQNERLIKSSESVSVDEIKSEINKSQALMNKVNTTVSQNKDDKGPLPYVIGGSVLVGVAGIIGYLVVKSKSRYFA
ncbi:15962_t:CDS:2, partial [Cetraspora pellucida]